MAYAMRHRGLAALRAGDRIDRAQRVMGTALVALGAGSATLGCLHGWLLFRFGMNLPFGMNLRFEINLPSGINLRGFRSARS